MIRTNRATRTDLPFLTTLAHEVHALHLAAWPDRYRDASHLEIEAWLAQLLDAPDIVVFLTEDARGYVVVRRVEPVAHTLVHPRMTAHVEQLGVRADARRAGHGRALMAAAEEQARAWGAVAITLDVQSFNDGARAFYQALGYEVTGVRMRRPL